MDDFLPFITVDGKAGFVRKDTIVCLRVVSPIEDMCAGYGVCAWGNGDRYILIQTLTSPDDAQDALIRFMRTWTPVSHLPTLETKGM